MLYTHILEAYIRYTYYVCIYAKYCSWTLNSQKIEVTTPSLWIGTYLVSMLYTTEHEKKHKSNTRRNKMLS